MTLPLRRRSYLSRGFNASLPVGERARVCDGRLFLLRGALTCAALRLAFNLFPCVPELAGRAPPGTTQQAPANHRFLSLGLRLGVAGVAANAAGGVWRSVERRVCWHQSILMSVLRRRCLVLTGSAHLRFTEERLRPRRSSPHFYKQASHASTRSRRLRNLQHDLRSGPLRSMSSVM